MAGIGDKQLGATIHKSILCDATSFFEADFNHKSTDSGKIIIQLPNDNPIVNQALVYWVYYNEICVPANVTTYDAKDSNDEEGMKTLSGFLVQLYVLGQKYQMPLLQNDAIDALLKLRETIYLPHAIFSYVYRMTTDGSTLRKVLLRIARYELKPEDMDIRKKDMCADFLFDIVRTYSEERDSKKDCSNLSHLLTYTVSISTLTMKITTRRDVRN